MCRCALSVRRSGQQHNLRDCRPGEFQKQGKRLSTWSIDYKDNHKNFHASSFQPDEDAPWVVRMAEFIGSEHTNVVLDTPALAEALYDSTRARDLPGMADVDSSLYLFCGKIKERFPVALSGECADEIFAGYPWYHRKEVLFYDGFPWSTAVPERASLMKNPMTACEAESTSAAAMTSAFRRWSTWIPTTKPTAECARCSC